MENKTIEDGKSNIEKKKSSENNTKPVTKKDNKKKQPPKKSREERIKEARERKILKVEENKDAIVTIAETNDAKNLAFKVQEISIITSFIRSNFGFSISFEKAQYLLKKYQESLNEINSFIDEAHAEGIGSSRALKDYKKSLAKKIAAEKAEKNRAKKLAKKLAMSREQETPEETKERETIEKQILKAEEIFDKAQEALLKAEENFNEAMEELKAVKELELKKYNERIIVQRERNKSEIRTEDVEN